MAATLFTSLLVPLCLKAASRVSLADCSSSAAAAAAGNIDTTGGRDERRGVDGGGVVVGLETCVL